MIRFINTLILTLVLVSSSFAKEHKDKKEYEKFFQHHKQKELTYTLSPQPNSVNVPADTKIKIIFEQEIDQKSLKHSEISLKYLDSHRKHKHVRGKTYFSKTENALIFTPKNELKEGKYKVNIRNIVFHEKHKHNFPKYLKKMHYTFSVSKIQDTTPPVITLNGSSYITLKRGTTYTELGATAVDDVDGNISVKISEKIDENTTGFYNVTYTAKDNTGNEATTTRTVEVIAVLESLQLTAETTTLHVGDTIAFNVLGIYDDGTMLDLTQDVQYSISNTQVGQISTNMFEGLVVGTTAVSVSFDSLKSNSINMSVIEPVDTKNIDFTSFGYQYIKYIAKDATKSQFDEKLFSMLTGKVLAEDGTTPLAGVKVSIFKHPEFGTQMTDANGEYVFAVEGGEYLQVRYVKEGYTTVDRKIYVKAQDWSIFPIVTMQHLDTKVTLIDLSSSEVQLHSSSFITDERGTRRTTLVFNGVTKAIVTSKDSSTRELPTLNVSATEFTTPESMPADLPIETAFTYCSDLHVEGVLDDENITFNAPVVMYVDNFLGFNVGEIVPVGYYDRNLGKWVCSENGVVIQLLDIDGDGKIDGLDSTGDQLPDDLNGNGSFGDEVVGILNSSDYEPGQTYWRAEITHFTPWDHNWPYGPPDDAQEPENPDIDETPEIEPNYCINSYVTPKTRVFNEDIAIAGSDAYLHYSTKRLDGYQTDIEFDLNTSDIPQSVKKVIVSLKIAGKTYEQGFAPDAVNIQKFSWDGKDILGNQVTTEVTATVSVKYKYDLIYFSARDAFERAWAKTSISPTAISDQSNGLTVKKDATIKVLREQFGISKGSVAQGWTLSNYDTVTKNQIIRGDGNTEVLNRLTHYIDTIDTETSAFNNPQSIIMDKEDNLYIADTDHHRIIKIDSNGDVKTIAGTGESGFSNDGTLAVNATLNSPRNLLFDHQNNLLFIDNNNKIRKIDHQGIIMTLAGNEGYERPREAQMAQKTTFSHLSSLSVDKDNNIFFVENDRSGSHVFKIDSCGILSFILESEGHLEGGQIGSIDNLFIDKNNILYFIDNLYHVIWRTDFITSPIVIAGKKYHTGFTKDGSLSKESLLGVLGAFSIDDNGNIYFVEDGVRIRKIDTQGVLTTIAGNGKYDIQEDGNSIDVSIGGTVSLVTSKDNNIYILQENNVRKISLFSLFTKYNDDYISKNIDNTVDIFDKDGRYKKTIDLATESVLKQASYNANNQVNGISDQFGNLLDIQRDQSGKITTITAPNGQKTYLEIDENNNLISVSYENSTEYTFEYDQNSFMIKEIDTNDNEFTHHFDVSGRIYEDIDSIGGSWLFEKQYSSGLMTYYATKPEGDISTYLDVSLENGWYSLEEQSSAGDSSTMEVSYDSLEEIVFKNGIRTETLYTIDPMYSNKSISQKTISQPSGLTSTIIYDIVYSGTPLEISSKTITISQNAKETIQKNDYVNAKNTITTPESRLLTTLYNKENRLTTSIQSGTLTPTTYEYDAKGRVISKTTGDRVVAYTYDQKGNIATITTPNNETTNYEYDVMDRVTKITYPNGNTEQYAYDANGNITRLTTPTPTEFAFAYNGVDKRTSLVSPSNYTTSYTYNKNRRLTTITRPSGATITNNYTNDRLSSTVTPEGTINYNYVFADQLSSISMGTESIEYSYDGDLLTSLTQSGTLNQSINYTYNNDFAVTSTSYAGVTTTYSYDNDGLLTQSGDFTLTRDTDNGYVTKVTDGTLSIDKEYNNYGELTKNSDNSFTYELQRNLNGNIIQKTETLGGFTNTYNYTYDQNARLIQVEKNNQVVESYTYDKNSNRISATINGITTQATYDQEDAIDTYGDNTYTYDTDGQLNQKITPKGMTTYSYNSKGTLTKVVTPTNTIEYILNPLGQRVAKKVDGTITEKYLWADLTTLLATLDANNNIIQRYNYTDQRVPTSMTQDNQTYYLHYDQVGTLKAISDINHNIVKEISYDTYGNILQDSNPSFTIPFGFAGGLHDRDTNLVHFGYREYDPYTGKWTTKDPIDFSGGDSNLYGHVLQDPVNLVDPEGLKDITTMLSNTKNGIDAINTSHAASTYAKDQSAANAIDFASTIAQPWMPFDAKKTKDLADVLDNKLYKDCIKSGMGSSTCNSMCK